MAKTANRHSVHGRPRMPVEQWIENHGLTPGEVEVCEEAADQIIACREWAIEKLDTDLRLDRDGCPHRQATEVIDDTGLPFLRRSQLMQIAAEMVHERGVSLADINRERDAA